MCLYSMEKLCMFTLYSKSSWAWRIVPFHSTNYILSRKMLYLRLILPNLPLRRVFSLTHILILFKKQFGKLLTITSLKLCFGFMLFLTEALWQQVQEKSLVSLQTNSVIWQGGDHLQPWSISGKWGQVRLTSYHNSCHILSSFFQHPCTPVHIFLLLCR